MWVQYQKFTYGPNRKLKLIQNGVYILVEVSFYIGMKYSWPPQVLLFIGQVFEGVEPCLDKMCPRMAPPLTKFFFQTGCIERQTKCMRPFYKDVGRSVVVLASL